MQNLNNFYFFIIILIKNRFFVENSKSCVLSFKPAEIDEKCDSLKQEMSCFSENGLKTESPISAKIIGQKFERNRSEAEDEKNSQKFLRHQQEIVSFFGSYFARIITAKPRENIINKCVV